MAISPQFFEDARSKIEPLLHAYLMRHVGRTEAEEVLQETYIRIFRKSEVEGSTLTLENMDVFRKYAFHVARYTLFDFLRRKRGR